MTKYFSSLSNLFKFGANNFSREIDYTHAELIRALVQAKLHRCESEARVNMLIAKLDYIAEIKSKANSK